MSWKSASGGFDCLMWRLPRKDVPACPALPHHFTGSLSLGLAILFKANSRLVQLRSSLGGGRPDNDRAGERRGQQVSRATSSRSGISGKGLSRAPFFGAALALAKAGDPILDSGMKDACGEDSTQTRRACEQRQA